MWERSSWLPTAYPCSCSRQEALALGLKRYFTGVPCNAAGHVAERRIKPDCCCECMRLRNLAYSRAHPEKFKAQGIQWAKDNPERVKAAQKRYEAKNAEREAARKRKLALKQHHEKYTTDPAYRTRKNAATKRWAEDNHEPGTTPISRRGASVATARPSEPRRWNDFGPIRTGRKPIARPRRRCARRLSVVLQPRMSRCC